MKTILCPECGSDQVGTLENIQGCALIEGVNEDGEFEWEGETEIYWDTSTTVTNESGQRCLTCADCAHDWYFGPSMNKAVA